MHQEKNLSNTAASSEMQPSYLAYANMMRIVAAIAPVLYHVTIPFFDLHESMSRLDWWFCNFILSSTPWVVGVILMLSGALLLDPSKSESAKVFYRKRLQRVGIPLIFWSVIYLAYEAKYTAAGLTLYQALQRVATGQTAPHLYFLFAIGGLYVFTPMMRIYIAHATRKELFLGILLVFFMLAGGHLASSFARRGWMGGNAFNKFIPYLGYFLLGYYLRNVIMSRKTFVWVCGLWIGSVILTAVGTYALVFVLDIGREMLLYRVLSPAMIITTVTTFLILSYAFSRPSGKKTWKTNMVQKLSAATLGVFLIHLVFVWRAHDLGMIDWLGSVWVSVPVASFVILVISYLITFIIGRVPYVRCIIGL